MLNNKIVAVFLQTSIFREIVQRRLNSGPVVNTDLKTSFKPQPVEFPVVCNGRTLVLRYITATGINLHKFSIRYLEPHAKKYILNSEGVIVQRRKAAGRTVEYVHQVFGPLAHLV